MNNNQFFEDIQDDLSYDITCIIDKILGRDVHESEKLELLNSILSIFRQQAKNIQNLSLSATNNRIFLPNNQENINIPYINIFFFNSPINTNRIPTNFYTQQLPTQNISPNPYYLYNSQQPIFYHNPYQSSNFSFPNSPNYLSNPSPTTPKSKSHKKSKHHHHKDKHRKPPTKKQNQPDTKSKIDTFPFNPSDSFNGIFKYLTIKTGGNIHENGTIEIASNSVFSKGSHGPQTLVQESNQYAASRGDRDAWVSFDFKKFRVEISGYSVKAGTSCSMKNWVLEISDDGQNWTVIDEHVNSKDLEKPSVKRSYKVDSNRFVRFCRIRHNGDFVAYGSDKAMQVSQIEFFGRIKSPL